MKCEYEYSAKVGFMAYLYLVLINDQATKTMRIFLPSVFLFCMGVFPSFGQAPFISTWKTDNDGNSCSTCIEIPTVGGGYNYEVDWDNDGTYDEMGITGNITHDFGGEGTYTIAIRGDFPRISFDNGAEGPKLLSVDQWGDIQWTSFSQAFAGCVNMEVMATDAPNLSSVTSLSNCFSQCMLSSGCATWDVSNISNFSGMFSRCSAYNEDLSAWDMSSATNTSFMFSGATSFNEDIGTWDVSNVTTMAGMFNAALSFNQDLSNWNVSSVTTMAGMFDGARVFNGAIGTWDVSNVTDMSNMFGSTSQVIFPNPNAFNQDIGDWDVSNVNNMAEMFIGCENFNQDIGKWDVSSVTNMAAMFREAETFNQDLSNWEVSQVTSMQSLFSGADVFDQDLGAWNLTNLEDAGRMLRNAGLSCENYGSTLMGWAGNSNTPDNISLGARGLEYGSEAVAARDLLLSKGWVIDGDEETVCMVNVEDSFTMEGSVYPNPVQDVLHIQSKDADSYEVIRLLGSVIARGRATATTINTSNWDSGIYLIRFMDSKGEVLGSQKIIKP